MLTCPWGSLGTNIVYFQGEKLRSSTVLLIFLFDKKEHLWGPLNARGTEPVAWSPGDRAVSRGAPCPVEGGNPAASSLCSFLPDQLEALQTLTQPFR